jgi:hypothetical protein
LFFQRLFHLADAQPVRLVQPPPDFMANRCRAPGPGEFSVALPPVCRYRLGLGGSEERLLPNRRGFMDWQQRTQKINVGDRVAYSAAFLRGTGQFTGDVPHARGEVKALLPLGETTLAEIAWDRPDLPARVNVANLCLVGGRGFSAQ